jgi:hypothetical protein
MKLGDTAVYVSFDLSCFRPSYEKWIATSAGKPVRQYIDICFFCLYIEIIRELV